MLLENFVLPGVLVPTACAAAVLVVLTLGVRTSPRSTAGAASLALAAAFLSAYVAITGWPRVPPIESTQRLFFLVVVAAVVGFGWGRARRRPPWPVVGLLLAALLWSMLRAPIEHTWDRREAALWLAAFMALGLLIHGAVRSNLKVAGGRAAFEVAGVRLLLLGCLALLLGLSGTAKLAQLAGALACGAVAVELVARALRRRPWLESDALMLILPVVGLLLGGTFYAQIGVWPAALTVAAWLALGFGSSRGAWGRWLPLVPALVAMLLAYWAFAEREKGDYDAYGAIMGTALRSGEPAETSALT